MSCSGTALLPSHHTRHTTFHFVTTRRRHPVPPHTPPATSPSNLAMSQYPSHLKEFITNLPLERFSQNYEHQSNLENCALLSNYTASSSNFLPTFRDNLSGPTKMGPLWSRNVGNKFPLLAAKQRIARLHIGGSFKSLILNLYCVY